MFFPPYFSLYMDTVSVFMIKYYSNVSKKKSVAQKWEQKKKKKCYWYARACVEQLHGQGSWSLMMIFNRGQFLTYFSNIPLNQIHHFHEIYLNLYIFLNSFMPAFSHIINSCDLNISGHTCATQAQVHALRSLKWTHVWGTAAMIRHHLNMRENRRRVFLCFDLISNWSLM